MKQIFTLIFFLLISCQYTPPPRPVSAAPPPTPLPQNTPFTPTVQMGIRADFRPSSTPSPPASCKVANTQGDLLNLRSGPGMNYPILGAFYPGQPLQVLDRLDRWLHVQAGNRTGYVFSTFCQ
jgi:hypothetical protein